MSFQARFYGGPWDGQRRDYPGSDPLARIEVPADEGGPFAYVLANTIGSWGQGSVLVLYEPEDAHL